MTVVVIDCYHHDDIHIHTQLDLPQMRYVFGSRTPFTIIILVCFPSSLVLFAHSAQTFLRLVSTDPESSTNGKPTAAPRGKKIAPRRPTKGPTGRGGTLLMYWIIMAALHHYL